MSPRYEGKPRIAGFVVAAGLLLGWTLPRGWPPTAGPGDVDGAVGVGFWAGVVVLFGYLAVRMVFSRREETRADLFAVDLLGGMSGVAELAAYEHTHLPRPARPDGLFKRAWWYSATAVGRLFDTHPPRGRRIARMHAHLQERGSP